ncbi:MAG: divalent-cation tolerance protein CutA [Betaproteobacteria bacterium]|nr:MAG: divalent-cation tolerance protein CutA [Betaproteobacteria bacterium]
MIEVADKYLLVLTNLPDRGRALELAKTLIERRLAGCVNVLDGCTSVYRWEGVVQTEAEIPMLIKTRAECFEKLQEAIIALHPYELPELIAFRPERALEAYLAWLSDEVDISG